MRLTAVAFCSLGLAGLLGCEVAEPLENPSQRLGRPGATLALGDSGEDVRAVNEYLRRRGYFPNEDLARRYPAWRPVVASAPVRADHFDDRTVAAVRALQSNFGLAATGKVDAPTRAAMARPRCGRPDGIRPAGRGNKFALSGSRWPTSNLSWRVLNTDDGVPQSQVRSVAGMAFSEWARETTLTFGEDATGPADILIEFAPIDGPGGSVSEGALTEDGGTVTLDVAELWGNSGTLRAALMHEIGHALGLLDSSLQEATMRTTLQPAGTPLHDDDRVAVSTLYDTWVQLPGAARDIGVGRDGNVWVIGTQPVGGGNFAIHRWDEPTGTWQTAPGGGVRIAVGPGGEPWVLNAAGQIHRRNSNIVTVGSWEQVPGGATDIGIGSNGFVWIVGTAQVPGGFEIFRGKAGGWDKVDGGAVRVSVDSSGVPWVTASNGKVYRRTDFTLAATWELMPGGATDIGVGSRNYPYVIGTGAVAGGFEIFVWNEQARGGEAPFVRDWVKLPGAAVTVAVGPNVRPWVINNSGQIFRSFR